MDKQIRKYLIWGSAGFALFILLDFTLLFAERGQLNSNIDTFGDAFWYMLVTITSVGYGDIVPVTMIGKGIGYFFILASLAVL